MLSGHSRLTIPPESHFITAFLARGMADGFRFEEFTRALDGHARFRLWGMPAGRIAADAPPESLAEAIRALYRTYATEHGKDRYGDKTPGYALHVPAIAELLPESVFVHLIRDGRDVALSLLDTPFGPSTVPGAAGYWKERVDAVAAAGRELGLGRYLEIRYEDLVTRPESAIRSICELAELGYEALDHRSQIVAVAASTTDPSVHASLREPLHLARDWRAEMRVGDIEQFEAAAGDSLATFGYALIGT